MDRPEPSDARSRSRMRWPSWGSKSVLAHTGEVEKIDQKVGGIAVNIGARVCALAQPSEILVSRTAKDLVAGSGLEFIERGDYDLEQVLGPWQLFSVLQHPRSRAAFRARLHREAARVEGQNTWAAEGSVPWFVPTTGRRRLLLAAS